MTKEERDRYIRNGKHLFEMAKSLGWPDDGGEGAYEYISRLTYMCGWDDHVARTALPQWKTIGTKEGPNEFPQTGMPFEVKTTHSFRWQPYIRPERVENKAIIEVINGVSGRWQFYNEHGNWINTFRPAGQWLDKVLDDELSGSGS